MQKATENRDLDLKWISDNLDALTTSARDHFERSGRGILVIDLSADGITPPSTYVPEKDLPFEDPDIYRMTSEYEPASEAVVFILKRGDNFTYYQVGT